MKVSRENICSYLPHRPPFVLVDSLEEAGDHFFISKFHLDPEHLLADKGRFTEAGLLENMAQTCAVGFGYLDSQKGGVPKIGFIGAMNRITFFSFPEVGQTIETHVDVMHNMEGIFLIKGTIRAGEMLVLEGEMKIVVTS